MGNIAHIQAYIDNNMHSNMIDANDGVMVELYVRPLTKVERELYAIAGLHPGSDQNKRRARANPPQGHTRNGPQVEKKSGPISRADLSKWKLNFQECA